MVDSIVLKRPQILSLLISTRKLVFSSIYFEVQNFQSAQHLSTTHPHDLKIDLYVFS